MRIHAAAAKNNNNNKVDVDVVNMNNTVRLIFLMAVIVSTMILISKGTNIGRPTAAAAASKEFWLPTKTPKTMTTTTTTTNTVKATTSNVNRKTDRIPSQKDTNKNGSKNGNGNHAKEKDGSERDGCGNDVLHRPMHIKNSAKVTTEYLGSKLELPLKPPYYIVQHGKYRSGSTFQTQLLQAIVELKTDRSSIIKDKNKIRRKRKSEKNRNYENEKGLPMLFGNSPNPDMKKDQKANKEFKRRITDQIYQGQDFFQEMMDYGFVQKSHHTEWVEKTICELTQKHNKQVVVFVSVVGGENATTIVNNENEKDDHHLRIVLKPLRVGYDMGYIAHHQDMKGAEFKNCSLCQIEKYYKPIFDLSDKEVVILKEYTSKYSLLRQCCGVQMSKYNRMRLHGCDVSEYQNDTTGKHSYPWCENHDLPTIELEFASLLEKYGIRPPPTSSGWSKPGECASQDEEIRNGKDFNGFPWNGSCSLESVDSTRKRRKQAKNIINDDNGDEDEEEEENTTKKQRNARKLNKSTRGQSNNDMIII